MKRDAKESYVSALVEHARRKTRGASDPVAVQAYRFFDEACDRADLPHPFNNSNCKQIIDQFTDELLRECSQMDGDDMPILVLKITDRVINLAGHGRQAKVDEKRTPEKYREAATACRGNANEGWLLFSPKANRNHPSIRGTYGPQKKRIETTIENYNASASKFDERLRVKVSETPKLGTVELSEIEARRCGAIE